MKVPSWDVSPATFIRCEAAESLESDASLRGALWRISWRSSATSAGGALRSLLRGARGPPPRADLGDARLETSTGDSVSATGTECAAVAELEFVEPSERAAVLVTGETRSSLKKPMSQRSRPTTSSEGCALPYSFFLFFKYYLVGCKVFVFRALKYLFDLNV